MLAHQLAATHKQIMELMGVVSCQPNADAQVKRINAAARCMSVYQQGMLALHKIRQKGQQRIMVQYVNVSQGSQAVPSNMERNGYTEVEQPTLPPR
jgi:hypothetical protein